MLKFLLFGLLLLIPGAILTWLEYYWIGGFLGGFCAGFFIAVDRLHYLATGRQMSDDDTAAVFNKLFSRKK